GDPCDSTQDVVVRGPDVDAESPHVVDAIGSAWVRPEGGKLPFLSELVPFVIRRFGQVTLIENPERRIVAVTLNASEKQAARIGPSMVHAHMELTERFEARDIAANVEVLVENVDESLSGVGVGFPLALERGS